MFEGCKQIKVQTSDPEVKINPRYGGSGPGILLLHGNPLTHVHWHLVAPRLAQSFTAVYWGELSYTEKFFNPLPACISGDPAGFCETLQICLS